MLDDDKNHVHKIKYLRLRFSSLLFKHIKMSKIDRTKEQTFKIVERKLKTKEIK
jgi:hypothetical protein